MDFNFNNVPAPAKGLTPGSTMEHASKLRSAHQSWLQSSPYQACTQAAQHQSSVRLPADRNMCWGQHQVYDIAPASRLMG